MKKTLIIITFISNLYGCEDVPKSRYSLYLVNNAKHSISFDYSLGAYNWKCYPDTLLPATDQHLIKNIKPGSSHSSDSRSKWEKIISDLPKDTMSVFIFHTDTLNKYAWEEVRKKYIILRRYDLSLEDLIGLYNKYGIPEIPYPPTEAMKNIKMYPPYVSE